MTRIGHAARRYSLRDDGAAAVRPGSAFTVVVVVLIVALTFAAIQSVWDTASNASASQMAVVVIEKETDELESVAWRAFATGKDFDSEALADATGDIATEFAVLEADHHADPRALRLSRMIEGYLEGLDHERALIAAGRPGAARRHHTRVTVPSYEAIDAHIELVRATERKHASSARRTADFGIAGSLTVAAGALILLFLRLARFRDSLGRARETELAELALSDSLTGLGNRRALRRRLQQTFAHVEPTALALIDLDGFKLYNDTFGHAAGDLLLRRLASRLAGVAAPGGAAYRLGGDEFCVLMPAHERSRMQAAVDAFEDHGEGFTVRASAGIVVIPSEAGDEKSALALADQRMYARKAENHGSRGEEAFQLALRFIDERLPDVASTSRAVATLA